MGLGPSTHGTHCRIAARDQGLQATEGLAPGPMAPPIWGGANTVAEEARRGGGPHGPPNLGVHS